jgi:hypothetical protein
MYFTMLRPVLAWRAVWNIPTVYLFIFPTFFEPRWTADNWNRIYWISVYGGTPVPCFISLNYINFALYRASPQLYAVGTHRLQYLFVQLQFNLYQQGRCSYHKPINFLVNIVKPMWSTFYSIYQELRASPYFERYLLILRRHFTNVTCYEYIACVIGQLAAVNWHNTHAIYQVPFV